jgi:histidine triad (HIT) family protein
MHDDAIHDDEMTGADSSEQRPSCVFCAIVAGQSASYVVHEDERTVSFLDIDPVTFGHTLVVPRRHSRTVLDVDPDDAAAVMRAGVDVARILDAALHPDGFSLFQANEPAGWQVVFHLHLHVIPRWFDDALIRPWSPGTLAKTSQQEIATTVGAQLRPAK